MIRPLTAAETRKAHEIWKICFSDADEFIDEYLARAASFDNSLGYYENGSLLSDLFMLEFQMKFSGRVYPTDFFAGCATLPGARRRGLMRELLKAAMMEMRRRGQTVCSLHPFLHTFYRQFGFETIAYVSRHSLMPDRRRGTTVYTSAEGLPVEKMEHAYAEYMRGFDHCFVRTHERFETWLRLLFSDGGRAAVRESGGHFSYALYYRDGGTAQVFELVPGDSAEDLLRTLPETQADYFLPAGGGEPHSEEFTMMRILNPAELLRYAPLLEKEFVFHICDDFLERDYRLLVQRKAGGGTVVPTDAAADLELDPAGLAGLLAGTGASADVCKTVLPQRACFFETY